MSTYVRSCHVNEFVEGVCTELTIYMLTYLYVLCITVSRSIPHIYIYDPRLRSEEVCG